VKTLALLSLCLLGACAMAPRSRTVDEPLSPGPLPLIQGDLSDQTRYEQDLDEVFAAAGEVDCGRAALISGQICDLAARICAVAERHPEDPSLAIRCEDARQRCQRARDRVSARCPGAPIPGQP
jgi:hypothetical protein